MPFTRDDWTRLDGERVIATTGMFWNGYDYVELSGERMQSMVETFNSTQIGKSDKPPIIASHDEPWRNPSGPRVGEIVGLRYEPGAPGKLWATIEASPVGVEMMESGQWPGHSIGFDRLNPDSPDWFLFHLALCGPTPPAISGMEPLMLSRRRESLHVVTFQGEPKDPEPPSVVEDDQHDATASIEKGVQQMSKLQKMLKALGLKSLSKEQEAEVMTILEDRLDLNSDDADQPQETIDDQAVVEPIPDERDEEIERLKAENERLQEQMDGQLSRRLETLVASKRLSKSTADQIVQSYNDGASVEDIEKAIQAGEVASPRRAKLGRAIPANPDTPADSDAARLERMIGRKPTDQDLKNLPALKQHFPAAFAD